LRATYTGGVRYSRTLSPEEFWQRQSALDAQVRQSLAQQLTYGLNHWSGTATLSEWSLGDATFRSVRYDDGPNVTVVVASDDHGDIEGAVEHLLINLPENLKPGIDLAIPGPEYRQRTAAGAVDIRVAGEATTFTSWNSGEFTVAGATVAGVGSALCWRGIDPALLQVSPIEDVEALLDGRRELTRARRRRLGLEE
jgi:hypothetical protein